MLRFFGVLERPSLQESLGSLCDIPQLFDGVEVIIVHPPSFDSKGVEALVLAFQSHMLDGDEIKTKVQTICWEPVVGAQQNQLPMAFCDKRLFDVCEQGRLKAVIFLAMLPCANLLHRLRRKKIKVALAGVHQDQLPSIGAFSFQKFPLIVSSLDAVFASVCVGDATAGDLGMPQLQLVGDLRRVVAGASYDQEELAILQNAVARRTVWAATHVNRDELEEILNTHAALVSKDLRALLLLHPKNEEDVVACQAYLKAAGLSYALYGENDAPSDSIQVLLDDELCSASLWHHAAQACFIGGSLSADGDIGPYEAVMAAGCPVIFGPSLGPDQTHIPELIYRGAARRIQSSEMLLRAIITLFETQSAAQQAQVAWQEISNADATRMAIARWSMAGSNEQGMSNEDTSILVP